ncbi:MAG: hypothetical protein HZA50_14905, partial [Planctomycetes bacterium]|nr:hypothetical protein [Planctomycetota bacterium]MBI5725246.1 hypothetical protein [Planctomycetota bacterium]
IVSQEDMTGGMVGFTSCSVDGYEPDSAMDLMRNVLLYVAGQPGKPK